MELPVAGQLTELGRALALGAGLGLLFTLLRPLRRGAVSRALLDGLWCLTVLVGLTAFALYAGQGRLRLFALGAMAVSGGLWLGLAAPLLRRGARSLGLLLRGRRREKQNLKKAGK